MTRPDPVGCTVAGLFAAGAVTFALNGWPLPAGILAGCAIAAAALFWHVPHCDQDGNDIEALITATRENIPDHVPAAWLAQFPDDTAPARED